MLFIDNKYTRIYYSIITQAQTRILPKETYTEKHHIIPECFYKHRSRTGNQGWIEGDPNNELNLVILTAREHFICHWLLTKMVEGPAKSKMFYALSVMQTKSDRRYKTKITSRVYSRIRGNLKVSEETKQKLREHNLGKQHTEESKNKMSNSKKGKTLSNETKNKLSVIARQRAPMSDEIKKKISKAKKGSIAWNKGKPHSDATKQKISNALKNKNNDY